MNIYLVQTVDTPYLIQARDYTEALNGFMAYAKAEKLYEKSGGVDLENDIASIALFTDDPVIDAYAHLYPEAHKQAEELEAKYRDNEPVKFRLVLCESVVNGPTLKVQGPGLEDVDIPVWMDTLNHLKKIGVREL